MWKQNYVKILRKCHNHETQLSKCNKRRRDEEQIMTKTPYMKVKKKKKRIAFGNKEHRKSQKSETRFDLVSSYATL